MQSSLTRLEAHGLVMDTPTSPLEEDMPPLESADAEIEARLEGLPSSLRSADPTSALEELAELIDAAEGEWASALGSFVRSAGIVADLVELVGHDDAEICALAIRVLGNLCSDAVDPQSSVTKEVVRKHNGFPRLLPHCYNEDLVALMYALGAIQNLCTSIEYAQMVTPPLRERIREVAESARAAFDEGMPQAGLLTHYAEGILVNIAMCEREQGTSHTSVTSQEEVDRRARAKREWRRARQQRQRQPSAAPPEPSGAPPLESTTAQRRPVLPPRAPGAAPPLPPRGPGGPLLSRAPMHPSDAEWLKQLPAAEWRVAEWSPFSSHCASPYSTSPAQVRQSPLAAAPAAAPAGAPAAAPAAARVRLPPSSLSRSISPRPSSSPLASPKSQSPKVLRSADLLSGARGAAAAASLSPKVLRNVRGGGAAGRGGGGGGERDASPSSWDTADWSPFSTPRGARTVGARSVAARPDAARSEPARRPRSAVSRGLERQLVTAVDGAAVDDGAAPHAVPAAAPREPGPSPAVTTCGGSASGTARTALPLNPRMLARRSSSGLERMEAGVSESKDG